ncbi:hypothetical protein PRIPAC_84770, partial [Pristionchus pacificus]
MRALLVLTGAFIASITTTPICPPKYFFIEDRCVRPYALQATDYFEIIREYAQAACDEDGAHLPIIKSDEDNDLLNRIALAFIEPPGVRITLVLGLVCDEETNEPRWLDGSSYEYEGPEGSDHRAFNCTTSMPASRLQRQHNGWEPENHWELLWNGDFMHFTSLCVIEKNVEEPTEAVATEEPDRNRCGDYEMAAEGMDEETPCYKVFTEPQSWVNAQKKCAADFGSLVAINTAE